MGLIKLLEAVTLHFLPRIFFESQNLVVASVCQI